MSDQNLRSDPFAALSQIFIDNQRHFNIKCDDLRKRTKSFADKLNSIYTQLSDNPFDANLNLYLNIEEEARLVLSVAKELEFHRENIVNSVDMLKETNKIKLNK